MTGAADLTPFEERQARTDLYRQRPHPLAPEVEFEAALDRLNWEDGKGRRGAIRYADIARLRLSYDPARIQAPRHVLDVETRDGGRLRISSTTYRGMAMWRPRAKAFVAFLRILHARLHAANPRVEYRIGIGLIRFAAYALGWTLGIALMAWGAVAIAGIGQRLFAILLAAMAAYFAWVGYIFARNNWPGDYDPLDLPEAVLPKPSEADV